MSSPVPEFRPCEWCERRNMCCEDEFCHFEKYGSGYGPGNPDYEYDGTQDEVAP